MNQHISYIKKILAFVCTLVVSLLVLSELASAAGNVSKGYSSNDNQIQQGMAVALSTGKASVEKASLSNQQMYVGIVTTIDDSLLILTDKSVKVYVANSGKMQILVSDVNGAIRSGDALVISPLRGVLMKASIDGNTKTSVAIAQANFDGGSIQAQEAKLDDGTTKQVHIGKIEGELAIKKVEDTTSNTSSSPLGQFGQSLTGHPVNEVRILIAGFILLLVVIVEGSIIYAAISTSITAVGRNPLSKNSIYKQLTRTSIIAAGILIFGLIGIYVVIWT